MNKSYFTEKIAKSKINWTFFAPLDKYYKFCC